MQAAVHGCCCRCCWVRAPRHPLHAAVVSTAQGKAARRRGRRSAAAGAGGGTGLAAMRVHQTHSYHVWHERTQFHPPAEASSPAAWLRWALLFPGLVHVLLGRHPCTRGQPAIAHRRHTRREPRRPCVAAHAQCRTRRNHTHLDGSTTLTGPSRLRAGAASLPARSLLETRPNCISNGAKLSHATETALHYCDDALASPSTSAQRPDPQSDFAIVDCQNVRG